MLAVLLTLAPGVSGSTQNTPRILEQDSTLDNLVTPPGYRTTRQGRLGRVTTSGQGTTPMTLIPGLGFDGEVFAPLVEGWAQDYRLIAVTLPGFGGTAAPPTPPPGTSFGEQTWTDGATAAIDSLIVDRDLTDAIVVGHWIGGTQIALELARRRPERVRAVVLLAGSARWVPPAPAPIPDVPLDRRVANVDSALAPGWFRTVTRETWDDNNFLPGDYAANPILGLRLWRRAASPPLHVWVRYLCEFFAQDATIDLASLEVPVLLLLPGLEGLFHEEGANYVEAYTRRSWGDALEDDRSITVQTIPDTRVVMWYDRPDAVRSAIERFLDELPTR